MGRFFSSLSFLLLLAGFFPYAMNAQDRIAESEGRGLIVRSDPSGARVFIDSIERGRTPLYMDSLKAGPYAVRVEKEGYGERRFEVGVKAGSVMDVSVELKEAVGRLLLKIEPASPGQAQLPLKPGISVDGRAYPATADDVELSLVLPAGYRTIVVRAFGWEDVSVTRYIEEGSFTELELYLTPASFAISGAGLSRSRFSPANAGSLGTTTFSFDVSAPGTGSFTVLDGGGKALLVRNLGPFDTWAQQAVWDGRDDMGNVPGDGTYTLVVKAVSSHRDDYPPVEEILALEVTLDSARIIHPLSASSGKSGLLYAPLPSLLPRGSFQIEGSLLAGSPPEAGPEPNDPWTSLPFAAAFRVSPMDRLEVSAALNVLPRFGGKTRAGFAGGAKWVFLNPADGTLPLGAAAGALFAWTGKTALTPFGMASGFEFFFPLSVRFGRIFSFALSPAVLWTGDEGFPWEPAPRLLLAGGFLTEMAYVSAGLSLRSEFDFSRKETWPSVIMGAEIKISPPPSSFVFSFTGGVWFRGSGIGGFGGLSIGMIY